LQIEASAIDGGITAAETRHSIAGLDLISKQRCTRRGHRLPMGIVHEREDSHACGAHWSRLAALAERDIFVLGSGDVVDNLRRIDWGGRDGTYDWVERFDAEVKRIMTSTVGELFEVGGLRTMRSPCHRSRQTHENTAGACYE